MRQFGFATVVLVTFLCGGITAFGSIVSPAQACGSADLACKPAKQDEVTQALIDAAIAMAQNISNPQEKAEILGDFAMRMSGEPRAALLRQSLKTTRTISDAAVRANALAAIAGRYRVLKFPQQQIEVVLAEAVAIVQPLPSSQSKKDAFSKLRFDMRRMGNMSNLSK